MNNGKHKYTIDTCSITKLHREYPRDVFPGAWDKVEDLAESGILISIEDVYIELEAQDDEVLEWANQYSKMFLPLDELVQIKALQVLKTHPALVDLKKHKSSADPFVIATALIYSCIVVTEEKPSNSPKMAKIPDVCKDHYIGCIDLLEMLRLEKVRLILSP